VAAAAISLVLTRDTIASVQVVGPPKEGRRVRADLGSCARARNCSRRSTRAMVLEGTRLIGALFLAEAGRVARPVGK
jgi:hypothetical protein